MMEIISTRKYWIDYAKVLGMVLIVWGHCAPTHLSSFVYAFDVPLFFWVSGYLSKNIKKPWGKFMAKSFRTLLVPMFLICMINLVLSVLLGRCALGKIPLSIVLVILGFHSFEGISGCGGMWFVYTMFLIKFLHNIKPDSQIMKLVLSVVFLIIGCYVGSLKTGMPNAWIDVCLAYPFFCFGNMCGQGKWRNVENRIRIITPICGRCLQAILIVVFSIVIYFEAQFNGVVYI